MATGHQADPTTSYDSADSIGDRNHYIGDRNGGLRLSGCWLQGQRYGETDRERHAKRVGDGRHRRRPTTDALSEIEATVRVFAFRYLYDGSLSREIKDVVSAAREAVARSASSGLYPFT